MKQYPKNPVWAAGLIGAGVLLPAVTNYFGVEQMLLAMYVPLLVAGFLLPVKWSVFIAVLVPVLNSILFGIPPMLPSLPLVVCETIAFAAFANLLYEGSGWNIYPALLATLGIGIVVLFCAAAILGAVTEGFIGSAYTIEMLRNGWPGLVLQVAVVPPLVKWLGRLYQKSANLL